MNCKPFFRRALCLAAWLVALTGLLHAQPVQVSLSVAPPYPIHLEDMMQFEAMAVISLTNTGATPLQIKLLARLEGDNGVKAVTKVAYTPVSPILLMPMETKVLSGAQLRSLNANLSENDLDVEGLDMAQVLQTETLPEGAYTVCVRAHEYNSGTPLSAEMSGCAMILLTHYDPPILIFPEDQATVNPQTPQFQLFNWTPTGVPGITRYRFELMDLTLNNLNNPNDAFDNPAVLPFYKQENLLSPSLPYDLAKPKLLEGHRYAWRVTAYDPANGIFFKNQGKSAVSAFYYKINSFAGGPGTPGGSTNNPNNPGGGGNGGNNNNNNNGGGGNNNNNQNNNPPPQQDQNYAPPCGVIACEPPLPVGEAVTEGFGPGNQVKIGLFVLDLVTVNWNGDKMSGTGRMDVPMFKCKVAVEFTNLQVNAEGKALSGSAKALYDLNANVAEMLKSHANDMQGVTPDMIKQVHTQVKNGQKYTSKFLADQEQKLPFAMMTEKLEQLQLINITAIEFTPAGARFNAFLALDIPEANNQTMGFGVKNVCFHPTGLSEQTIDQMHMVGTGLTFPFGDKIDVTLKGESPKGGTYIKWGCDGYQEMQVDGEFAFKTSLLKPANPDKEKLTAGFTFNIVAWGDIVGQVDMDSFTVAGADGLVFKFQDVTLDFSDYKNPPGMKFPAQFNGDKGNTWRGFYFKKISLFLPEYLKKKNTNLELAMTDCIINKQGFTGGISVSPFLSIDDGNIGGWSFSIDKLTLAIVSNSLTGSSFDGKIRIPIAKSGIGYHCSLSTADQKLTTHFSVENTDALDVEMWIAKFDIAEGSSLSVKVENKKVVAKADLTGKMTIKGEFKDLPAIDVEIPDVAFENLVVSNGEPFLDCKKFSLSSPQKSVNGFNISFDPKKAPADQKENVGVKLEKTAKTAALNFGFLITLHEGKNGITGISNLSIIGQLKEENKLQTWSYQKVQLNSIYVDATMSVVRIKGEVNFFHGDDKDYGKGFRGQFSVTFKPTFTATATVQFGKVNGYKYWFVDAKTIFKPGIAVGPAFALYGFGGGAYYHMKPESLPDTEELKGNLGDPPKYDPQKMGATGSGIVYKPDQETLFGFKASVVFGTFPSPRPFNGDVELEANFGNDGSLGLIKLTVNGYFMCDVTDRSNPKVKATGVIQYMENNGQRLFDATLDVTINIKAGNKSILTGNGGISIHAESALEEGEKGKWWVLIGEPDDRVNLTIFNALKVGSYLMLGNSIPGPPALPPHIQAKLPNFKHTRVTKGDEVAGFGFGQNFTFDTGELKFLILYARLLIELGYDLFIIDSDDISCPNTPNPGINGFYGVGQAYAGFDVEVGLDINVWFLKAKFPVFAAYLYAALQAGLPNPTWVKGAVSGHYEIFNGLAEGSFTFNFTAGEICDPSAGDPFGGLKVIGDVTPKGSNTDVFSIPEAAFNLDLQKEIIVEIPNEEGETDIQKFRFFLKDMTLKRTKEKKNGKMVSLGNGETVAGKQKVPSQKLGQFIPNETLMPFSEYEMTVRVYGERWEGGKWVVIQGKDKKTYYEEKKQTFTTGNRPDKFVNQNIAYTFPHRMQRHLCRSSVSTGVIQFIQPIDYLFDIKPQNSAYKYQFVVKFSRVKSGAHSVFETPLTYNAGAKQVTFQMPEDMQPEQIYMIQFMARLIKDPNAWLANNTNQSSVVTAIETDKGIDQKSKSEYTMDKKVRKIEGQLIQANEHELYRMFFRTGKYSTIDQKWSAYKHQSVEQGAGDFSRRLIVHAKGQEAWDRYDLLPFAYYIGSDKQLVDPIIRPFYSTINDLNPNGSYKGHIFFDIDTCLFRYVQLLKDGDQFTDVQFQGCNKKGELFYDFESQMEAFKHRSVPSANNYPPNSLALTEHSFSDLESAKGAIGLKYTGNGATALSMSEVNDAYFLNYNPNQGSPWNQFAMNQGGQQGGGGPTLPNLNIVPASSHTMDVIYDHMHVSFYAKKDLAAYFAGHGNMGLCGNAFRDHFNLKGAKAHSLTVAKKGHKYHFDLKAKLPDGAVEKEYMILYSNNNFTW